MEDFRKRFEELRGNLDALEALHKEVKSTPQSEERDDLLEEITRETWSIPSFWN